jgi:hypothetical protein
MSLFSRLADLELVIDDHRYERLEQPTPNFTRVTTVLVAEGAGQEGRGEDVNYVPETHDGLADVDLRGRHTVRSLSQLLDELPLDPASAPQGYAPDYRRWAFESAALDLALRQAGTSLGEALGLPYRPVRFCVSTQPVDGWLAIDPDLEFKLDATPDWSREYMEELAATDRVRCVDLKAYYVGTVVDNPPDPRLYRDVVECFPDAIVEDAKITDETRAALEPAFGRMSWDAPIHSLADVRALPIEPRIMNIKPSRFGSLERLLECIETLQAEGVALYGGGQYELGPGRFQIQALASLFYPDAASDIAPGGYNAPAPAAGLPRSPLPAPERPAGFAFGER